MAWLSGWGHRKEISITGQSGAGTDYQVKVIIGDSAGGDFHLEGNCTNFPQDITVTDNDGTTPLKYWIEDITADPITMWVKVDDDLGSNQEIYVYYEKSGATTDSDGDATFLQYHGSASSNFLDSVAAPYTELAIHVKWTRGATTNTWWGLGTVLSDGGGDQLIFKTTTTHEGWYYWKRNDGGTWDGEYGSPGWDTNPHISRINYISDVATLYVDDVHKGTSLSNDSYKPNENMGLGMFIASGTASQDWSFVRKLIATEPAFSSAGSEESAVTAATNLLHGKIIIKDSSTNLADGKLQVQDVDTDLFDGEIKVIEKVISLVDGKLQVQDVATSQADGKLQVKDSATSLADGKVQIQDTDTDLTDGKLQVQDVDTDLADSKVQIQDSVSDLADGLIKVQDSVSDLADGKIQIKDVTTSIVDGLIQIKDTVVGLADGKIRVKDTVTNVVDGILKIKDTVTSLADGKVTIQGAVNIATNLFNGILQIPARYRITTSDEQQHTISIINDEVYYTIKTTSEQQHNIMIIEEEE